MKEKACAHCGETFIPRRRNHKYCSSSCKTMASYRRNNYEYKSGCYNKNTEVVKAEKEALSKVSTDIENKLNSLSEQIDLLSKNTNKGSVNVNSVTNAVIGTATSDAIIYGVKKLLAPKTLLATKQDVSNLKNEIDNLKLILQNFVRGVRRY